MKTIRLLPHRYKTIGWIILIPSVIMGAIALTGVAASSDMSINGHTFAFISGGLLEDNVYFSVIRTDLLATILGVLVTTGSLLVAFSREKQEDESIASLRLSSFQWAVLVSYTILLLCFLTIFGLPFLTAMSFNMFTVILLFIIRFNYLLYKSKHSDYEK